LNPISSATSLKHCLHSIRSYFCMTAPVWPHLTHTLAPFPYLLGLPLLIFAVLDHLHAEL